MADEPDEPDDVAIRGMALDRAAEARRWLRVLVPIIHFYDHDATRPHEVQTALDTTLIAACARIRRLVRSDLGAGDAD